MPRPLARSPHPHPFLPAQRDFLIEVMEAKGEQGGAELYAEERQLAAKAEEARRAAVPGLSNPYSVKDDDDI